MFEFKNDPRIYLYDCVSERYIRVFDDYNALLLFLAREVRGNLKNHWMQPFKTSYLNDVNMGADYKVWNEYRYYDYLPYVVKEHVDLRRYMYVDAYNRIIDPRQDYQKILALANNDISDIRHLYRQYQKMRQEEKDLPVYRQDPVPGTGVRKHGNCIRHPQSMREKRQNSDPETMQFVRPSRRVHLLPDPWDDERWRPYPKSWKDCTKRKHQWKEKTHPKDSDGFYFLE